MGRVGRYERRCDWTPDMRVVVLEQRLGDHPTVSPDGLPNLSPKGTTTILDDEHLIFVHINSPQTIANLRASPAIETNCAMVFASAFG